MSLLKSDQKSEMKAGFVAIAGRPNSGKSTLLNRVLDARLSIVSPKAQTTRERVLGILNVPQQGQIVFVDTPGIHRARDQSINSYMVNEAREGLDGASVIWYLVDPDTGLQHEQDVWDLLKPARLPVYLILNKADLARPGSRLLIELEAAMRAEGIDVRQSFTISAKKGTDVPKLLEATWPLIPQSPPYYPDLDQLSDRPTKFFVAEMIREQLLMNLGDEIPYSCAVEIERFDENPTLPRIEAVIHVERDSQKGMVIGKSGAKIKDIGTAARATVEKFMGQKVFLGLRVHVLKDWSRDPNALRRLGYHLPEVNKPNKANKSNREAR